jgi:hypothetical protein
MNYIRIYSKETKTVCTNATVQDGNKINNRLKLYLDKIITMYHLLLGMLYKMVGVDISRTCRVTSTGTCMYRTNHRRP